MNLGRPAIVVVTPVRNEASNLRRFLSVTSRFADVVIVEDQCSTDASVAICGEYPKVVLLQNRSSDYDEAGRQQRLLQKARALVPGHRIILALDADEILAADATQAPGWRKMLEASPGTILLFEKPDLYESPDRCIRYANPWPLGFVDDGSEHRPQRIHSIRIPTPPHATRLVLGDVKILHYAMLRLDLQASKRRFYCVQENVQDTSVFWRRRLAYSPAVDWTQLGTLEKTPERWFSAWEDCGIDMRTVPSEAFYWTDYEVLKLFGKFGSRRFWLDPIWEFDWQACSQAARDAGIAGIPKGRIAGPPRLLALALDVLDSCVECLRRLRRA